MRSLHAPFRCLGILVPALMICSSPTPVFGQGDWTGHVNFFLGQTYLRSGDWDPISGLAGKEGRFYRPESRFRIVLPDGDHSGRSGIGDLDGTWDPKKKEIESLVRKMWR